MLHAFEKTSDTTLSGSYISPKQHFDNIKDFKVTERNSFKTIKDILLIILSKNNGILRIIEAKFDGENWKAKESATHGRIRKMTLVSKFIGTKYRQVCMLCYAEYDNYV